MIPKRKDLELPLLELLAKYECLSLDECTDKLSAQFYLTHEDRNEMMPNGKCKRMRYNVGWVKDNLKHRGFVDIKRRGVYYITDKGRKFLKQR